MNEQLSENLYEALLLRVDLAESAESEFLRVAHVKAAEEIYAQLMTQSDCYTPAELSRAERTMQFLLEVERTPIIAQEEESLPIELLADSIVPDRTTVPDINSF